MGEQERNGLRERVGANTAEIERLRVHSHDHANRLFAIATKSEVIEERLNDLRQDFRDEMGNLRDRRWKLAALVIAGAGAVSAIASVLAAVLLR